MNAKHGPPWWLPEHSTSQKGLQSVASLRNYSLVNPYAAGDAFLGKSDAKPFRNPSLTMLFLATFCSTFSILLVLLLLIFQSPNRNVFVLYVAKRWTSRIVTFSPANVAIKYVCGVGIASKNQNLVFVLPAAHHMEMIHTNLVR